MSVIAKWIRHNQGIFVALLLCGVLIVWTFGCQSKVTSIIHEDKKVTAEELNLELDQEVARLEAELELIIRKAELKEADLKRQDALKQELFDFAAVTAQGGGFNPSGLLVLTGSVLGFGAIVDNRIKDKVIKNRPLKE